ncbi:18S rRNA (guanine-N(7))-methyltransferase RID2, partial [Glycine soja]
VGGAGAGASKKPCLNYVVASFVNVCHRASRIVQIQATVSKRALELIALPDDRIPKLLLDIGCGTGLNGETISENGHHWIGLDISASMPNVVVEREVEGDLLLGDMGQGLGIHPGVMDGAISIYVVRVCFQYK